MTPDRLQMPRPGVRRLPYSAETLDGGGVHFRVWAPRCSRVDLVIGDGPASSPSRDPGAVIRLDREDAGFFSVVVQKAGHGTRYQYRLDGEGRAYPDPASRFQPDGPHEASQVIDPSLYRWSDAGWCGLTLRGQVIYELHVGTFTLEGDWAAATRQLERLADLGITVLEVMPVCEFPGRFGWGYDGVDLFAPTRLYGTPDEFRAFVDAAHSLGLGVILDVVYNHLGPEGNYIEQYADSFFTDRYPNEWGDAINFDGEDARPVRDFIVANAGYWIREFHLDGFRFDATQQIFDASPRHILSEIGREARTAAQGRSVLLIAENESQIARIARPEQENGFGLDALWNDDFHHSSLVVLVGLRDAYFTDYAGSPQEFVSAAKYGYLYQGQYYTWQKQRRGTPTRGLQPERFVAYLENHDQVANSLHGKRLHQLTAPGKLRALTGMMLLLPGTPMLFQGQEFASSRPFLFFSDLSDPLTKMVAQGRTEFLTQFPGIGQAQSLLADPSEPSTFTRCKLQEEERLLHAEAWSLHRDLLRLRREDPVFRAQGEFGIDGAVIAPQTFVLRFFGAKPPGSPGSPRPNDRLMVVNLGPALHLDFIPEPLAAPPDQSAWRILWSSEDARYGGGGIAPIEVDGAWRISGCATIVLESEALVE